jgi:hypothetical protein
MTLQELLLRRKRSSASSQAPVTQKAVTQTTRMDVRIRKSPHAYLKLANRFQVRTTSKLQSVELHTLVETQNVNTAASRCTLCILLRDVFENSCICAHSASLCNFAVSHCTMLVADTTCTCVL